jgi:hypothetical protein
MRVDWYRGLFAIDSSKISILLFLRVAAAVGVPLFGFVLAGHVAAGADTGGWLFAVCCAGGCALALLAAERLRVSEPVWATFTVFLIMVVELGHQGAAPALALVATRLYDVGVGCAIALGATLLATVGRRGASVESPP